MITVVLRIQTKEYKSWFSFGKQLSPEGRSWFSFGKQLSPEGRSWFSFGKQLSPEGRSWLDLPSGDQTIIVLLLFYVVKQQQSWFSFGKQLSPEGRSWLDQNDRTIISRREIMVGSE